MPRPRSRTKNLVSIEKENLDGFIFLGDNVYGDIPNGKLLKMQKAYQIQREKIA